MDACNQLKPSACDRHARRRASVGVIKYSVHKKLTTVAMPLPFQWWLNFGVDPEP